MKYRKFLHVPQILEEMSLKPNHHHILLIYYYKHSEVWELDVAIPKDGSKGVSAFASPNLTITYDNESIPSYVSSRLQAIPKETVETKLCGMIASLCGGTILRSIHAFQDDQHKVGGTFAAELEVSVRAKDWEKNLLRPYTGGTTKLKEELNDGLVVKLVKGDYHAWTVPWSVAAIELSLFS